MNYKYEIVLRKQKKEKTIEVCKTKRSINRIITDYINIKKSICAENFKIKEINECTTNKQKNIVYSTKSKFVEDLRVGDTIIIQYLDDFPHTIKRFIKYAGPLDTVYCYVVFLNGEKAFLQNNCFYKEIKNNI